MSAAREGFVVGQWPMSSSWDVVVIILCDDILLMRRRSPEGRPFSRQIGTSAIGEKHTLYGVLFIANEFPCNLHGEWKQEDRLLLRVTALLRHLDEKIG